MPDEPVAPKPGSRLDDLEQRLDRIERAPARRPLADRLALRGHEVAEALGLSKSSWHSYCSRGIAPPSISTPGGHVRLYLGSTLADWLRRSEAAGHLLTRDEYVTAVEADEAESHERRRG
jgi:hypothetical protein